MRVARANIDLTEEFSGPEWVEYDAYDAATREHFRSQRHVDIRTFTADSNEQWTGAGEVGSLIELGNFPAMYVEMFAGVVKQASSIMPERPVDLMTGFSSTDFVILGLPLYPGFGFGMEENSCYVEFTSHPEGNFGVGPTAAVSFAASLQGLFTANNQFIVHRSAFETNGIDLSKVTGVRFTLKGSQRTGVRFAGLRLVSSEWVASSVDFDTRNGRLRKTVPRTGSPTVAPELIQSTLWKAANLPGPNDPMPIDMEVGLAFYTGSLTKTNSFTLLFREEPMIFQNQLDLIGVTMAELDGRPQPDLGTAQFLPRTMSDLDAELMEEFDDLQTMESLERRAVENPAEQSWVYFQLQWYPTGATLTMTNSESAGYVFPGIKTIEPGKSYFFVGLLEGSSARVQIYKLNTDGSAVQIPVFDSGMIEDDAIFRRRPGRFGWQAALEDADAYIDSIRPRKLCFAEYLSAPLESITPVDGAQLFADFTDNKQLWDGGFNLYPATPSALRVTRDTARSTSGESFKVVTSGEAAYEGLATNLITFTEFDQAEIHFELWLAGEAKPFQASLVSPTGATIPFTMPKIEPNQWQLIKLQMPEEVVFQTGQYKFQILSGKNSASTWWIDSVSIFQRAVQWSARSTVDDPWHSNYAPWTDFREVINVNRQGILLFPRGKELQLRGRALVQNASIKNPRLIPRYAQLGRLVWPEEERKGLTGPSASFTKTQIEARRFGFTGTSTLGTGAIVQREWDFGDGTRRIANDISQEHTYALAGEYYVTLILTDRNGLHSQFTEKLTVF